MSGFTIPIQPAEPTTALPPVYEEVPDRPGFDEGELVAAPALEQIPNDYGSPRWSGEIHDCAVPMTLDTYSLCSYGCLYCFANYQKDIGHAAKNFKARNVRSVNVERVKRMFLEPESSQFGQFIKDRRVLQWGGMADPFDEFERKHGITLDLLRFFREINYPVTFSTKAVWWTEDPRYVEAFKGFPWFNVKVSIITMEQEAAKVLEAGVPSPDDRMAAIERAAGFVDGGMTLRLRPFVIGCSERTADRMIRDASAAGATALSTEFFCLEMRSVKGQDLRYPKMSKVVGYDIVKFYQRYSPTSGYLRLNREIKRPYIEIMQRACADTGMRMYVSDAHWKDASVGGACCGLPDDWNASRGQFTQAVKIAQEKGEVRWADLEPHLGWADFKWTRAQGFNTQSTQARAKNWNMTMRDYLRHCWNDTNGGKSPYQMFGGLLKPIRVDEGGNVVYAIDESKA